MKKFLYGFIALLLSLTLSACEKIPGSETSGGETSGNEISVPEKPSEYQLEFWICEDVSGVDFSEFYHIVGMFGGEAYYGKGYAGSISAEGEEVPPEQYVKYTITAWPDYADGGQYVTEIEITDPAVKIYSLTCKSSFAEFDQIMQENGYTLSVHSYFHMANKGGIRFSLEEGKLRIIAEVSNRDGIIF